MLFHIINPFKKKLFHENPENIVVGFPQCRLGNLINLEERNVARFRNIIKNSVSFEGYDI